jgi:hypothetical protein
MLPSGRKGRQIRPTTARRRGSFLTSAPRLTRYVLFKSILWRPGTTPRFRQGWGLSGVGQRVLKTTVMDVALLRGPKANYRFAGPLVATSALPANSFSSCSMPLWTCRGNLTMSVTWQ